MSRDFAQIDRYKFSVVDVCVTLHGQVCGTGIELDNVTRYEYVAWLTWRLHSWSTGNHNFVVDDAVRQLVIATLAEVAGDIAGDLIG